MKAIRNLSIVALFLAVSCNSTSLLDRADPQLPPPSQPPALLEQALPPLPMTGVGRAASLIGLTVRLGIETVHNFGNVIYGASTVDLVPPAADLACVVYALPVNGFSYDEVTFDITFDDASKLWFGIADYRRGCWDLTPAFPGITGVAPPYSTAHAPDGNCYFAVIACNDTTVTVNQVSVVPNIPTWQLHVIDDRDALGGSGGDIALIDGYLYVAYNASDIDETRLARATVPVPTDVADWDRTVISASVDTARLDMCQVSGVPAILIAEG